MPPFPERESSILAILKKKKPGRVAEPGAPNAGPEGSTPPTSKERKSSPAAIINNGNSSNSNSNQNADLLGLTSPPTSSATGGSAPLVDVLADVFNAAAPVNNGFGASFQPVDNIKKYS